MRLATPIIASLELRHLRLGSEFIKYVHGGANQHTRLNNGCVGQEEAFKIVHRVRVFRN